jgi:hypothetical protein
MPSLEALLVPISGLISTAAPTGTRYGMQGLIDVTIVPLESEPDRKVGGMGEANHERCNKGEDRRCQAYVVG